MSTPSLLEVGEVFRRYGHEFLEAYGDVLSFEQRQVFEAIATCRTPALGGHLYECDACAYQLVLHNSCLNRHCPLCQASEAARWLDSRLAELLPVDYFHITFTIPSSLDHVALQNKRVVYDILFQASSQTLLQIAADPKHLGAKIGFIAILHSWGQALLEHAHVHCVVSGGGPSPDSSRWVATRPDFFAPVHVLSRLFRGKLLSLLEQAFNDGKLSFHGSLAHLANVRRFRQLINSIRKKELVVHAQEPHGNPKNVLRYLSRYTHRVALSNSRLISIAKGRVTFRWKDYAHGNRMRTTTLDAVEFIRRFLLHVFPKGFVRIRSYGFMANRARHANLELCRRLLQESPARKDSPPEEDPDLDEHGTGTDDEAPEKTMPCPACGKGRMVRVMEIPPINTETSPPVLPAVPSRRSPT